MSVMYRARYLFFVLIGVAGLLLKSWFSDALSDFAISYLGNLAISFAVYYIFRLADPGKLNWILCLIVALLVVELFEATNGFGVMTNVYDPFDYVANALGVALAITVDIVSSRLLRVRTETPG